MSDKKSTQQTQLFIIINFQSLESNIMKRFMTNLNVLKKLIFFFNNEKIV